MELDDEQRAAWARDGYLVLRGALAPERVAEISGWVDEVEGWAAGDGPAMAGTTSMASSRSKSPTKAGRFLV